MLMGSPVAKSVRVVIHGLLRSVMRMFVPVMLRWMLWRRFRVVQRVLVFQLVMHGRNWL